MTSKITCYTLRELSQHMSDLLLREEGETPTTVIGFEVTRSAQHRVVRILTRPSEGSVPVKELEQHVDQLYYVTERLLRFIDEIRDPEPETEED